MKKVTTNDVSVYLMSSHISSSIPNNPNTIICVWRMIETSNESESFRLSIAPWTWLADEHHPRDSQGQRTHGNVSSQLQSLVNVLTRLGIGRGLDQTPIFSCQFCKRLLRYGTTCSAPEFFVPRMQSLSSAVPTPSCNANTAWHAKKLDLETLL